MSVEDNKALIYRIYEELNKGNYDIIDECFADNFTITRHNGEIQDRETFKQVLIDMTANYTDIKRTIEDVVVSDDKAALFFTWEGIEKREQKGRAEKPVKARLIYLICFENGRISEYLQYYDPYGMADQLDTQEEVVS